MLWQKMMIRLATNPGAKRWMQESRKISNLATRFVGGQSVKEAAARAGQLLRKRRRSSLFYLGEYVRGQKEIEKTLDELGRIIQHLAQGNLDIHISVDPTQV